MPLSSIPSIFRISRVSPSILCAMREEYQPDLPQSDVVLLREGVKLARRLGQTAPLSNTSLGSEIFPGPGVATDEEIDGWLAKVASTEYHPIATCAMMPESRGGVVDAKLKVYGLGKTPRRTSTSRNLIGLRLMVANVRVVDASVFPIAFSAHVSSSFRMYTLWIGLNCNIEAWSSNLWIGRSGCRYHQGVLSQNEDPSEQYDFQQSTHPDSERD